VSTLEWASISTPVGPVSVGCGPAGVAQVRFGPPPAGTRPATAGQAGGTGETGARETRTGETRTGETEAGETEAGETEADETEARGTGARETGANGNGNGGNGNGNGNGGNGAGQAGDAASLARAARRQLAEYFCGQRREFDLPLDWSGFAAAQRQVLRLLYDDVGYGRTVTYGALAGLAGLEASADVVPARAVGQIMGSNPIPVIVPCHRVVASDGLGGYSGGAGPEVKRWLLILEGSQPPTLDWTPARPPDD
jgi:methylated-DNA-[protein]-cysteine S-methyltransferase